MSGSVTALVLVWCALSGLVLAGALLVGSAWCLERRRRQVLADRLAAQVRLQRLTRLAMQRMLDEVRRP